MDNLEKTSEESVKVFVGKEGGDKISSDGFVIKGYIFLLFIIVLIFVKPVAVYVTSSGPVGVILAIYSGIFSFALMISLIMFSPQSDQAWSYLKISKLFFLYLGVQYLSWLFMVGKNVYAGCNSIFILEFLNIYYPYGCVTSLTNFSYILFYLSPVLLIVSLVRTLRNKNIGVVDEEKLKMNNNKFILTSLLFYIPIILLILYQFNHAIL